MQEVSSSTPPTILGLGLLGGSPLHAGSLSAPPPTGNSATLVSLKSLAYGNYSVPLRVLDQQGKGADEDLSLVVCNCGTEKTCRKRMSPSSSLGGKGALTLICGILFLLCTPNTCSPPEHTPCRLTITCWCCLVSCFTVRCYNTVRLKCVMISKTGIRYHAAYYSSFQSPIYFISPSLLHLRQLCRLVAPGAIVNLRHVVWNY